MDIFVLLEKMEDIIDEAGKLPLTNKIIIEKEDLLEIISEIRLKLPEEINRANWVAKERQRILTEAQAEADNLLEKAKRQQDGLLSDTEIMKMAKDRANEILTIAENKAYEIKVNSLNYSDELLAKIQEKLAGLLDVIEENRRELRNI